MSRRIGWLIFSVLMLCFISEGFGQQDVDFHLNAHLFPGKKILKVKRDFYDPYLWVLAQNNEVYRVNSLTLAVDDYTSKFAVYSNMKFIDIAGRSQDTVFVASNSTSVIEYKKGILKDVGQLPGISGTVNQVGMDHIFYPMTPAKGDPLNGLILLMIATSTNIYYYDCANEIILSTDVEPADNRLFETTYRTQAYSNLGFTNYYDPIKQYSTINRVELTIYGGALWYNTPEFGYHINTAYYTIPYGYDVVDYMTQLWGTETGLFQNNWNRSYFLTSEYKHYLDGIKVNKVTSIYGLKTFEMLTKENLLVGTDNGFYFSNSGYRKYIPGPLDDFNTFTYDTEIGNKVINDVCVNATSYSPAICEDGVWVAAADGLYLLKPDYGKYLTSQIIQAINFKNEPGISSTSICSGSSVTAIVDPASYSGHTIQWYQNGNELPAQSADTLSIKTAGEYYSVLYDPCSGVHLESNHLKVNTINSPVFTFDYPALIKQCNTTPYTFTTDNNPGYHYRWYTNGVLNGDTTYSFVAAQSGKYKVEVSACTNSWVPSKEVALDMYTIPLPQITPDKSLYCAEDVATLTESAPIDTNYTINWYLNGNLIAGDKNLASIIAGSAGDYTVTLNGNTPDCVQTSAPFQLNFTPAQTLTQFPAEAQACDSETLGVIGETLPTSYRWYKNEVLQSDTTALYIANQTGKYRVETSVCPGSWTSSNTIQVDIVNLPFPTLAADKKAYCTGDNATLSANVPVDPSYTINWYKDNVLQTGSTNQTTLITNIGGNYQVIVVNNKVNYDGTTCADTSAVQTLTFTTPPTVSVEKIINTTLCDGQTVNLLAHYSGGNIKWSTGETAAQISVTTSGTYKATITSPAGCQVEASADVVFLANPVFTALKDTSVCVYKSESVTLIGPSGYSKYTWNGVPGDATYRVSQPQTVTLTVTDANGCQAKQHVVVADVCPDIFIPNTFTPNNDRINDTWVIEGIQSYPMAVVRVFNRYGIKLYESTGYGTPWNGEYGGKKVPAAVYYYIINLASNKKIYSGPLTIIY